MSKRLKYSTKAFRSSRLTREWVSQSNRGIIQHRNEIIKTIIVIAATRSKERPRGERSVPSKVRVDAQPYGTRYYVRLLLGYRYSLESLQVAGISPKCRQLAGVIASGRNLPVQHSSGEQEKSWLGTVGRLFCKLIEWLSNRTSQLLWT
jgi:hypothetical protein